MITKLTPNLIVTDVDAATSFYERLGFVRVVRVPETGEGDFSILVAGNVELMLQTQTNIAEDLPVIAGQPVGGGCVLYLEVDDVKGLHDTITPDVPVVVGLRDTFYGSTEFYVQDPWGYTIGFAQPKRDD